MAVGDIGWIDLTVNDAAKLRDFYREVTGWEYEDVAMGGYADYNMLHPATNKAIAGICHRRGVNADLPAAWLIYIVVADLQASLDACLAAGGSQVTEVHDMGKAGRFAVIRDPAGALCALFSEGEAAV
jgi:predicted enzyme related to lactoylglutathione lyase